MNEFIVIVESDADARTATELAERILIEKIEWLERDTLKYLFRWSGLQENTDNSCWKDIKKIVQNFQDTSQFRPPRFLGRRRTNNTPLKADGAAAIKILNLVYFLQKERAIKAVFLIRDLDNQPERREGLEQARMQDIDRKPKLEIVLGTANRMREAWVLNGFIPANSLEEQLFAKIKQQLAFDPCTESEKLRSTSREDRDRLRNPKVIVGELTATDMERERQCWEETSLMILQERGKNTGLTDYIREIEERLVPIICES
ncbi:hypothetical protein IQ235_08960 [Oscillatoriales cyanobacterium LEGE 11467]|uniref:Uncharacterized protein n=1 Tax=Zarconia navalis LEGE 11467 TaxID=1828826 RepID=A0A928VY38_9CYAN|nr:hypothetical protein [Zarconia navalis]MBE9040907.1 hypothetical protein [Zarconia navalis LEGE 11467]